MRTEEARPTQRRRDIPVDRFEVVCDEGSQARNQGAFYPEAGNTVALISPNNGCRQATIVARSQQ
ncbi:hypothetical protein CQ12_22010 [Bradyrhizobium jicamae]|uniref:Uncharacterized protein n=1 Tax=Bradyrhizobium jicamae TaxID=280332 RepID=A0A0R3M342_9BRAD|nr:hypothetical protein CQ12_22010 [Bradyrhizobium jicamae]